MTAKHAHSSTSATPRVTRSLSVSKTDQQMITPAPNPERVNLGIDSQIGNGFEFYLAFSDNRPCPIIQPRLAMWLEGYDLLKKKTIITGYNRGV